MTTQEDNNPNVLELTLKDFVEIHNEVSGFIVNVGEILEILNQIIEDLQTTVDAIKGKPTALVSLSSSYITRLISQPILPNSSESRQITIQDPPKLTTTLKDAVFGNPFAITTLLISLLKLAHKFGYKQIYKIKVPKYSLTSKSIEYLKQKNIIHSVFDGASDTEFEFSLAFLEIFDIEPNFVDLNFERLSSTTGQIKDKIQSTRLKANEMVYQQTNKFLGFGK
jgi:hypothetical protein